MTIREINDAGYNLIKSSEGCKLEAYLDGGGVPTIGYGHTQGVHIGMKITQDEADAMLDKDIYKFSFAVQSLVDVELTNNQFSALVCLTYNIGIEAFIKSTLLKLLNAGDYNGAEKQFLRWDKDNGKQVAGLHARREREAKLFAS